MTELLHIISDTNIGGGGRSLLSYLQFYDPTAYSPRVVVPRGSALIPHIRDLSVPVHEIDAMADKSLDLKAVTPLRHLIQQLHPDLIHTHGSLSGRIAARLEGKRVVYTKHCAFPPGFLRTLPPARLLTWVADGALSDGVVAVGPSAREILQQTGIAPDRIHVLLNGVAPLKSPTPEDRRAARLRYGFSAGDFVVGILARVEPYKGQDILLQAAQQLTAQGRQVAILVAGEGSFLPQLRKQAESMGECKVVFAGFVPDPAQALWAMDVQVNASTQSETSSLSLLEGMSIGLPAAVSRCGGNPLLISHGENGLVFENRDPNGLAECLARLMDEPDLRRSMEKRSIEIFRSRFTGEHYARNLEDIYRTVLKGAKP